MRKVWRVEMKMSIRSFVSWVVCILKAPATLKVLLIMSSMTTQADTLLRADGTQILLPDGVEIVIMVTEVPPPLTPNWGRDENGNCIGVPFNEQSVFTMGFDPETGMALDQNPCTIVGEGIPTPEHLPSRVEQYLNAVGAN
jgi:hypothetical protein